MDVQPTEAPYDTVNKFAATRKVLISQNYYWLELNEFLPQRME